MVRGTATDKHHTTAASHVLDVLSQPAEPNSSSLVVDPTSHGVLDRRSLLKDFLDHKVREGATVDTVELKVELLDGLGAVDDGLGLVVLLHAVDAELAFLDVSDCFHFEFKVRNVRK